MAPSPRHPIAAIVLAVADVACGGNDFTSCPEGACQERPTGAGGGVGSGQPTTSVAVGGQGAESGSGTSTASVNASAGTAGGGGEATCVGLCAPLIPDDWAGPMELYVGPDLPPGGCGELATALSAHAGQILAPAQCDPCTCGPPSGYACGFPTVTFRSAASCTGYSDSIAITSQSCTNIALNFPAGYMQSYKISAPAVTKGSCVASGGALSKEPITWSDEALVCQIVPAASGTCRTGLACVPKPADPFPARICVAKGGTADCPAQFPAKNQLYSDVDDGRSCSACSCNLASTSCGGTLHGYPDGSDCVGTAVSVTQFNTCKNDTWGSMKWTKTVTPGTCPEAGGQMIGTVTPTGAYTVCCTE